MGTRPVVIGVLDDDWQVQAVSEEVLDVLGFSPHDCDGLAALSIVHPDDRPALARSFDCAAVTGASERLDVRIRDRSGDWLAATVVIAALRPAPASSYGFVMTLGEARTAVELECRIAELESRLRRIAVEIHQAGLGGPAVAGVHDFGGSLSGRQKEIVERILDGQRVVTIARELCLSRSTVRNHLSQVFRKFGVGSQAELVEVLRRKGCSTR